MTRAPKVLASSQLVAVPCERPRLIGWNDRLRRLWFAVRKHVVLYEGETWDGSHLS